MGIAKFTMHIQGIFLQNVIISYGPFMVSKMRVLHSRGGHIHFVTNNVQKKKVQLIEIYIL